ncbi:bifunctional DNA-formamidopyrimidine glycosylase/DNA-(apurinic or apyrimidinic site) lyase [Hirschia litorea]|uniref:Formamidopyrimidine-DNA glycosylase n=1 Tax=Hirschia litorea TaxID=1199156 RepID=A0ABW2INN9_9PROT
MPELPEVETVRRGLSPAMEGRAIERVELRRADLRFPFADRFAERLKGVRIERLGRRAKFLMAQLSSGEVLTMHLGMTGRFSIEGKGFEAFAHSVSNNVIHDHVVFHMEGGVTVTFNDPRRFGFMELYGVGEAEKSKRFAELGPEPLSNSFSSAYLSEILKNKSSPIKSALLDQRIVAGLGNIYVCEALFRSGISPVRKSSTIAGKRAEKLVPVIKDVIREAIDAGGSSISDFAQTDGKLGYFQHSFLVYGQEGKACKICDTPIMRISQSGRSTFYCTNCQK